MDDLYRVEFFVSHRGESFVDELLNEIPEKHRGKILQWMRQLEIHGPNLPRPYADVLDGPVRELRVQFGNNKYRFLYFIHQKKIVLTHGFLKKTGPVPSQEIEKSKRLRVEWMGRKN